MTPKERAEIRQMIADYMSSEGCGCCRNHEAHEKHTKALAKVLKVRKYEDGSGYDFAHYRSAEK